MLLSSGVRRSAVASSQCNVSSTRRASGIFDSWLAFVHPKRCRARGTGHRWWSHRRRDVVLDSAAVIGSTPSRVPWRDGSFRIRPVPSLTSGLRRAARSDTSLMRAVATAGSFRMDAAWRGSLATRARPSVNAVPRTDLRIPGGSVESGGWRLRSERRARGHAGNSWAATEAVSRWSGREGGRCDEGDTSVSFRHLRARRGRWSASPDATW
jgi:hypothetical protein